MYIFTKRFFNLSLNDQAAVIAAAIDELRGCIGRLADPGDEPRVRRQIERIEKKAVEFGIYQ